MHTKNITVRSQSFMLRLVALLWFTSSLATADSTSLGNIEDAVSAEVAALHQSALNGSAQSQFEMGQLFEYGRDVQQNDANAAYWYEKSAAQNFAHAQYRLAILHDYGWGGEINKEKAFVLYKAAAENGIELAQHDLAIAYLQGSGVKKNLLQAYKWLKIADLNGNPLMLKHLKLVAAGMSLEEIEAANNLAALWIAESRREAF